jgi:ketosteroid isomerase-like protein
MFVSCENIVQEDNYITDSDGNTLPALSDLPQRVPDPPQLSTEGDTQAESRGGIRGRDWLGQARKRYLALFFAFVKYEIPLAAYFFPQDAQLDITSYDPSRVPLAGSYTGTQEVLGYFKRLYREFDINNLEIQYQLAEENYVSSHIRLQGSFQKSGRPVDMELVFLFKFADSGFIESSRMYYDTQVWTRGYQNPGNTVISDTKDPTEDHRIRQTSFDVKDLVGKVYDSFYAGDVPGVFELLSPDAAVYFKGDQSTYPYAGVYQGSQEILEFIQNLAGTAQPYNIEMFQVSEGDRTDVVLFEEWTVFATGKSYHVHTVNSWKVGSDGLLLGFSNFPDSLEIEQAYIP